jgi:YHS domain-containing protein
MGVVCTQLQDYVTATKYFEHARNLDPGNPELLADMGYSAYLQRDYQSAEVLLSESIQIRPGDTRAVNNLAMSIGFQGRYEESLILFRQVNSETQALLNLAFVQSQKNEPNIAMATYQRVLAQEPGNKVANSALQQLHAANQRIQLASQATRLVAESEATAPPLEIRPLSVSPDTSKPRVSTIEELPSPVASVEAPLIFPDGHPWTATAPKKADASSSVTDSEFELPLPAAPPAELAQDPVEEIAAIPSAADDLVNIFSEGDSSPESETAETEELTELDWAQEDLARQKAAAESSENLAPVPTDCLRGHCPVALRDERRLAPALDEFTTEYQAQTYRFSSAKARDAFLANPEYYIPMAGGLDVIQVKHGDAVAQGSLEYACWFRHRLHLFSTAENLAVFRASPRDYASTP